MTQQLKHSLKRREAKRKALHAAIHTTNDVEKIQDSDAKDEKSVQAITEVTPLNGLRRKGARIVLNDF